MNNISKSIGFIGIGLMGISLIQRLSNYDQVIYAFDKDKKTLSGIKINNVHSANDAAEVAKKCDIIFICVDKTENVEHAVFDDNGVIQNYKRKN